MLDVIRDGMCRWMIKGNNPVRFLIWNLPDDFFLTVHGIDGHDATFEYMFTSDCMMAVSTTKKD